jgi:hypothetical protein
LRLADYEDILDIKDIYSIISYASYLTKYYGQCSRAFIKLESVDTLTQEEREKFKKMALGIFVRNAPNGIPLHIIPHPIQSIMRCLSVLVFQYTCASNTIVLYL